MKKHWFLLLFIVILAFLLRVYKIGTLPLGVHPDEASWGYNAYSIIKTGADEHGVKWPLIFKAFGDQKPAAYVYTLVPIIKLFGLNNFAVRLPSAIIGTLITILVYLLLRQLRFSNNLSLLGALIAASSPWAIVISRIFGYDSGIGLFFFLLALWLFFFAKNKKKLVFLIFSSISFGLTWYSYPAYRFITPLIILLLIYLYYFNTTIKKIKPALILMVIFFITVSPLLLLSFSGQGSTRFNQVISTPVLGQILEINESRNICTKHIPKFFCYLNSNKPVVFVRTFISRFFYTFSPNFLFIEGDKDFKLLNVDNFGLLQIILIPFYLMGLVSLWNKFINKSLTKNHIFIIAGLIICSTPALLVDQPQPSRLYPMFPFLITLIIYGALNSYQYLRQAKNKIFLNLSIIVLILIFGLFFILNLFIIHFQKYETVFHTPHIRLLKYLNKQGQKTQIYISGIDEAIVMYAYLNKTDPLIYQQTVKREPIDEIGFAHATDLQNIHVTNKSVQEIYCQTKKHKQAVLFTTPEDLISPKVFTKSQKIIYSEDKLSQLQYVYNLKDLQNPNLIVCK